MDRPCGGCIDLKHALLNNSVITIPHNIESVKIIPPEGKNEPGFDLYFVD